MINLKHQVIEHLTQMVGKDQLVVDPEVLNSFVSSYQGFIKPAIPICMVYAMDTQQIQDIVKLANDLKFGIVPCSSESSNRLNASALPSRTNTIILNLSRMNRVFRIDKRNRIAFVEAGVTFDQLEKALDGSGLMLERPFRARANKSVLTSLLDREPTTVPMNVWDVNDPLLCMEVVFGDGTVFRTGSSAGPGTLEEQWEAGVAMNNSMGPSHTDFGRVLSGSQGTLAIATWASVKLEYCPSILKPAFIQSKSATDFTSTITEAVRRRLGNDFVLLNKFALANVLGNNADTIDKLAERVAPWTLCSTIAGKRILPAEKVDYQLADLSDLAAKNGLSICAELPVATNETMINALHGLDQHISWKFRYADNCIDVFFLTTLTEVDRFVSIANEALSAAGGNAQKMAVYVQPSMQARYCHVEFVIPFANAEKQTAYHWYSSVTDALLEAGAFFSRPYGPIVDKIYQKAVGHARNMEKMKDLFDPKRVLNPGKLSYQEVNQNGSD